ncbi:Glutaredoxin [Quillaja saponaria]|uniref:Glutaredoxin n=1 Tax=Quillaja saponaria TaxID=32244 RepID=A0AAD7Q3A1_QUISA|nr:Glutaredoxin [Quillaja saponaria]
MMISTLDACGRVKRVLQGYRVRLEERDLWEGQSQGYLNELKELWDRRVVLPSVFVKGRYSGGIRDRVGSTPPGTYRGTCEQMSIIQPMLV